MIACRLERCGSSVYVQKKRSSTADCSGGGILVDELLSDGSFSPWLFAADTRRWGAEVATTDGMMIDGMMMNGDRRTCLALIH